MDITPSSQGAAQSGQSHTHLTSAELNRMLGGIHFRFPSFKHDHPPVINVNEVADQQLTMGERIADNVAEFIGSWKFIIGQAAIMACWVIVNTLALFHVFRFDIYPFVFLNLAMSAEAAFSAPIIMMSQNRQADKDRLTAQNDYQTDSKGEEEIRNLMDHLDHQDKVLIQIISRMEEQHHEMLHRISQLDPELAKRLGIDIVEMSAEEVKLEDQEMEGNA
jgi:uncharacterized membrane protein